MPQSSIANLKPGARIHLMGICGTAMASLAGLLKDRGFTVSGSDLNPYPPMSTQIENLGIQIQRPYRAENLQPRPDFVVVGNVISASNEEAQEMVRLEIPYCSLPQAMGEVIIGNRDSFVVAGTHGKTTTTSLMAWVAENCGLKPGFLIGGIPKNFSRSFRNPAANTFMIEGDEYDTAYFDKVPKFIHYRPRHVILTSVEFDHADIYPDFAAVKAAFMRLMKLIPADGSLVFWGDDAEVRTLAAASSAGRRFAYGFGESCDYRVEITKAGEDGRGSETAFRIHHGGKPLADFVTPMAGRYNILNAAGVIAQAHLNGFDMAAVQKALRTFEGVKRRQEILGEFGGVLLIEDFAHHPTAVRETVRAIQERYPGRRVFSVFEPRSATSRRKVFQKDYVKAFGEAQEILIAQAFDQGKIDTEDRFSSDELIADLRAAGKSAGLFRSAAEIVDDLAARSAAGDVILIMSNGGFDGIYEKLISRLKEKTAR